jgi:hypothetical protein
MAGPVTSRQGIAVTLIFNSEVFMLGALLKMKYTIDRKYASEKMGDLKPVERMVEVRKF